MIEVEGGIYCVALKWPWQVRMLAWYCEATDAVWIQCRKLQA